MPKNRSTLLTTSILAFGLLFVGIITFRDFLFGHALLLYKDIGNDSLLDYYPTFVQLSNYVRANGFPSWSFHIGMGQDLAYATGYLIWQPVTWLPQEWISFALVFQHFVKLVVAGLLFFHFSRLLGAPVLAASLGAFLLAFSAYANMGSCWFPLVDEVIGYAAVLFGIEKALQGGRLLILALAVALVGMINPFQLYLCALLLVCYVPARLVVQFGWQPRLVLQKAFPLAMTASLGAGMGAVITLPYLNVILNSPRGAGATNSASTFASVSVFALASAQHYVTAVLRAYSNDLMGAGSAFKGWYNYLEAPLSYCGLFCLLMAPQAFVRRSRRTRLALVLFLVFALVPTIFPWFRHLFWLFKGDYYRTYSLFCVFGILTFSVLAFGRYLEHGLLSIWLLAITIVVLVAVLYLPLDLLRAAIDVQLRSVIVLYLALYAVILVFGRMVRRPGLTGCIVLAVAAVEVSHFAHITAANRETVHKEDLFHGIAAPREPIEMLQDIRGKDNSFFRVTTLRLSERGNEPDLNNSMLLGYYGTSSYTSFNDLNYIRFLAAVDVIQSRLEIETRWTPGLTGIFILSLFAGEKYALVEDPTPFQQVAQYEFVRSYGKYSLLRNRLSVPLGLSFSRYLPQEQFLQLSRDAKEQALLAVAVLDQSEQLKAPTLSRTSISELDADLTASTFPELIEKRRATGLSLTGFSQSRLRGEIHLERDSLLVVQTPFSPGWRAFQDGKQAPIVKTDVGLLGVALNGGNHKVELRYRNPWLVLGALITLCSAALFALALWCRRNRTLLPLNIGTLTDLAP
jgi:uncharacterized membrane protein YfhO